MTICHVWLAVGLLLLIASCIAITELRSKVLDLRYKSDMQISLLKAIIQETNKKLGNKTEQNGR